MKFQVIAADTGDSGNLRPEAVAATVTSANAEEKRMEDMGKQDQIAYCDYDNIKHGDSKTLEEAAINGVWLFGTRDCPACNFLNRSGDASSVFLQLPEGMKTRIRRIMRRGISYRFLVPGVFVAAVLSTALESVCTGQVYVPTLVYISGGGHSGAAEAFFYLLSYNLMFVLPLGIVFGALYFGAGVFSLVNFGRRELVIGKIAMGVFFLVLAAVMLNAVLGRI